MYCKYCGYDKIEEAALFCPKCGKKIENNILKKKDGEGIENNKLETISKTSKVKKIIISVFIIAIIVIGIISSVYFTRFMQSKDNIEKVTVQEVNKNKKAENIDESEYVFPYSDKKILSDADVNTLSEEELGYARNEIIARKGRIYTDTVYKPYFESKSWYHGTKDAETFDANYDNEMNDIEKENIKLIQKYERKYLDAKMYSLYAPILNEYQYAMETSFTGEHTYVVGYFKLPIYDLTQTIYYTLYDFANDKIPELVIAIKDNNSGDDSFEIIDMYGSDGTSVQKLVDEHPVGGTVYFAICENNIAQCLWQTGGMSVRGIDYYQMNPFAANASKIEGIYTDSSGRTYKQIYEDSENPYSREITKAEWQQVESQYSLVQDIQYEWKYISEWSESDTIVDNKNAVYIANKEQALEYLKNSMDIDETQYDVSYTFEGMDGDKYLFRIHSTDLQFPTQAISSDGKKYIYGIYGAVRKE